MKQKIQLILCAILGILVLFPKSQSQSVMKKESDKVMYLTFDDGPSQNTEKILDILDQYHIKATFFVTAEHKGYLDMIHQAHERGHMIGVHTYSHDYEKIYQSSEAYFKDLEQMNDIIEQQIGHRVKIMRFPGGSSNTISKKYHNGIMTKLTKEVLEKGYQYYDWNASNGDGNSYFDKNTLIETGKREVQGKDRVMMLMHDAGNNKATLEALPILLSYYQSLGYEFKVIEEDCEVFHHHVAN